MEDGKKYWEGIEADVNGMLGGIPSVTRIDLQGSRTFLARLGIGIKTGRKMVSRALEGGAGIGRVTEGLLTQVAEKVDIIEPITKFTDVLEGKPGV
ncbi:alpha-N-methyltransferase NTM1 [Fusarium solani]|nr:alpha-N-methyltransferase NTM1 [Fusarium solani]KAH7259917.1 alpha-N-methyltransferase NTM1 [Fusarium solani]